MTNQRWRGGRASYRPSGEVINPRHFDVAPIDQDGPAKAFVLEHHYSGTYPAARFRFGLYRGAERVGVAVFSHPCSDRVLTTVFDGPALESVELGRFVLLDDVAGNGETWFLARCFEQLRALELRGVVSFSDPMPRDTAAGDRIFPGHIGTIYQAHNGVYLGQATPRSLRLLPDGQVMSARALQKIRSGDRGWRYSAELLERAGATTPSGDPREWLREQLPLITRLVRHPGNHKYAWPLAKRVAIRRPSYSYPKFTGHPSGDHHVPIA